MKIEMLSSLIYFFCFECSMKIFYFLILCVLLFEFGNFRASLSTLEIWRVYLPHFFFVLLILNRYSSRGFFWRTMILLILWIQPHNTLRNISWFFYIRFLLQHGIFLSTHSNALYNWKSQTWSKRPRLYHIWKYIKIETGTRLI